MSTCLSIWIIKKDNLDNSFWKGFSYSLQACLLLNSNEPVAVWDYPQSPCQQGAYLLNGQTGINKYEHKHGVCFGVSWEKEEKNWYKQDKESLVFVDAVVLNANSIATKMIFE